MSVTNTMEKLFTANSRRLIALAGVLLMALTAAITNAQVQTLDRVVAIVDDDIILATELQERLVLIKRNIEQREMEATDAHLVRACIAQLESKEGDVGDEQQRVGNGREQVVRAAVEWLADNVGDEGEDGNERGFRESPVELHKDANESRHR